MLPVKIQQLVKDGQPVSMPARGAEQFLNFEPAAVSVANKIPASYVTKNIAEHSLQKRRKTIMPEKRMVHGLCIYRTNQYLT